MTDQQGKREALRQELVGVVTSNKMDKTVVVQVKRKVRHERYGKVVERSTICYAHDEKSEAKMGDKVRLMETRPLSKLKRWRVAEVIHTNDSAVTK